MAVKEDYLQFIEEQLSEFGEYDTKKMFGGMGFFRDGMMFAMIAKGIFRLKADDSNRADFEAKGMSNYQTKPGSKGMPYWEVPADVLEDKSELAIWANKAFAVAQAAKKK